MKSVLITGGTGFFGRGFIKKLLNEDHCDRVCIYSRGEHTQAELRDSLPGHIVGRMRFFIGDVRDRDRLRRAMEGVDTVVHAAALKRIEVGAYNPIEMVRTNVDGAINVIEGAQDEDVDSVVLLSTDKAYQPISPYGQSKAMAEGLFNAANHTVRTGGPKFTITRYGNVFNSTGSVVPRWRAMQANGLPTVPLTDPECTRFFMTSDEASGLVLEAVQDLEASRRWNQPFTRLHVPSLPAYRLGDLAVAMGVTPQIIGLPAFEKRHESMGGGASSDIARRMSVEELKEALKHV